MSFVDLEAIKEFSDGQVHEDDKLKCYMSCAFHETGMMDPDDKVNLVRVLDVFEYDNHLHMIVINMMRKCLYPQGDNNCEKAFYLHKCWKNADPKVCVTLDFSQNHFVDIFGGFQHYFLL